MLFVDSNVPIYLVGREHPLRDEAAHFLANNAHETWVTSAEVYQECVHRFIAIDRRQAVRDCFELLDDLVDLVYPIERADVDQAAHIASLQSRLSGRDALHIAVMQRYEIERIVSFDRGFDLWPGIERLPRV